MFGTAPGRRTRQEATKHRAAPDACAAPGGPAAAPSRTEMRSTCAGQPSMDKSHPSERHALHDSFMLSPQHRLGQSASHPSEPHALHVSFTPSLQHRLGQSASTVQASNVGQQVTRAWELGPREGAPAGQQRERDHPPPSPRLQQHQPRQPHDALPPRRTRHMNRGGGSHDQRAARARRRSLWASAAVTQYLCCCAVLLSFHTPP